MTRLIYLIARLYPRSWRDRYGDEFSALLEDSQPDWRASLDVLKGALNMQMRTWSLEKLVAAAAVAGMMLAAGVSYTIPNRYQSETLLLIDHLENANSLERLPDLEGKITAGTDARNVNFELVGTKPPVMALKIGVRDHDPAAAQRGANALASRAFEANLDVKVGRIVTIEVAQLPKKPIFPNHLWISAAGLGAGLLLGLLIALFRSPARAT